MDNNKTSIYKKLRKVLSLTKSCNENEALNALQKLEELCETYGVTKTDLKTTFIDQNEEEEVIMFNDNKRFKTLDYPYVIIIKAVTEYFNGTVVVAQEGNIKYLKIIATESRKIQIELYSEFLMDVMEKLSLKAKKEKADSGRSYRTNWKKGFACKINTRLREKKEQQEREGIPNSEIPGIVLVDKNARERSRVQKFLNVKYPRRKNVKGCKLGTGTQDGQNAASNVGLDAQTTGSKPQLALKGY